MKIVIVGGGTAGWFTAGYYSKFLKNTEITLIEAPSVPKIGVGESMHPYVSGLLVHMGIDPVDWMNKTGSTYKYGNKFVNWVNGTGEYNYSAFAFSFNPSFFHKEISHVTQTTDWFFDGRTNVDYILELANKNYLQFEEAASPHFHYMENNSAPYNENKYILNPFLTWSQHINAEISADYVRDHVGIPNGVKHILQKVKDVETNGDIIKSVLLENNERVEGDLFIDASGFAKILVNKLGWKFKTYENNLINRAWVCQSDYEDPKLEMVNYTQSIAEPYGWRFKIGLYHRMGNGYCYSSEHLSDDEALAYFKKQIPNKRTEPRLLKWTPERLEKFAKGNLVAIGLSGGFIEPIEATAIYIIASSMVNLMPAIKNYNGVWNFDDFNNKIGYLVDDISDFSRMHYALSNRTDTAFWIDAKNLKDKYSTLPYEKFISPNHTMLAMSEGRSLFPEISWAQRAMMFGLDTTSWYNNDKTTLELSKLFYDYSINKHKIISSTKLNNYLWHKKYIFDGLTSEQWGKANNLL